MPRGEGRRAARAGRSAPERNRIAAARGATWVGAPHSPDESAGAYDKTGAMIKPCLLDIKALLRLCHVHALEV